MEREEGKGQLCVVHVGALASQAPPQKSPTPSVEGASHRLMHISESLSSRNHLFLLLF